MTGDRATLDWYAGNAPRFTFSAAAAPSRHLDAFLDRLEPGARVLELGCGTGRDAARIVERGFVLDATDGVAAMARKARERYGIAACVMRFDELAACAEYDAIWAHACLHHVARADLPAVLARIARALVPGGWHSASYKLGDGEGRDALGRLHNFPDRNWIEAAYAQAGFASVESQVYAGKAADGTQRDLIALTMQARSHG